jgi:hypothetical protein
LNKIRFLGGSTAWLSAGLSATGMMVFDVYLELRFIAIGFGTVYAGERAKVLVYSTDVNF